MAATATAVAFPTKKKLDEAEKAADKYTAELDDTEKQAKKTGENVEKLSGKLTVAVAAIATAAVAAGGALAKLTLDTAAYADEVKTLETQTGLSAEKIQEFNYAAELVDVSVDTLTNSMAKQIKSMKSASDGTGAMASAYATLGVVTTDVNGELRDSETVYWEVIDALGKMENDTERDVTAMQILGKSAQDLNPIIKTGSERMKELGREAHETGYVMSGEALDGFGALDDASQRLKLKLTTVKNTIAEQFLPVLLDVGEDGDKVLTKLTGSLKKPDGPAAKLAKSVGELISFCLELAEVVLPPLINVLSFVTKNLGTFVTITLGAVAAIKTFSIVQSISALLGTMGGTINIVTAAQYAWNAAIAANPIGLIASVISVAIVSLIGLVSALTLSEEEYLSTTEKMTKAEEANTQAARDRAQAFEELKQKQAELAAAELSHLDNVERLNSELNTLVSTNGEVKEADKARVEFILNELNEALGTEYSLVGSVVENYKDLKKSIDDVIATKKAQILLDAQEGVYTEALEKYIQLQNEQAAKSLEIAEAKERLAEAQKTLNELEEKYKNGIGAPTQSRMGQKKIIAETKELLEQLTETYEANEGTLQSYYSTIAGYEGASAKLLEGDTQSAIAMLENMTGVFTRASEIAKLSTDEQKRILKEQLDITEENARLMAERYKNGVEGVTQEMVTQAEALADEAYNEYAAVGGTIPKAVADGIKGGKSKLQEEMLAAYRDSITATREDLPLAKDLGKDMADGMENGIKDRIPNFKAAMREIVRKGITAAKVEADIKSPSRKMRNEVGLQLGKGAVLGVVDSTRDLLLAVADQMKQVQAAYQQGSRFNVDFGIATGVLQKGLYNSVTAPALAFGGGSSSVINVYPQELTEAQVDYLVTRVNREFGRNV